MRSKIRRTIFKLIDAERDYQEKKWGDDFDEKNTINDWVTYICRYASNAAFHDKQPVDQEKVKQAFIKVATLALAALEMQEKHGLAPRHYDEQPTLKEKLYGVKFPEEDK